MVGDTVITHVVPSALARYGVGWDDGSPSRTPISAQRS
jgi:hypothetical protein